MAQTIKNIGVEVNIEVTGNTDTQLVCTRKDADGNVVNITGYTYYATIYDAGWNEITTVSATITTAASGLFKVLFDNDTNATLSIDAEYQWDLYEDNGIIETPLMYGKLTRKR